MTKHDDVFDEYYDPEGDSIDDYKRQRLNQKRIRMAKKASSIANEVGEAPLPSPEILAERASYRNDFVLMHRKVFPDSTGQKPFGEKQQKSVMFGQDVFQKGGRLLKLEPRAFAKTTRITNEAVFSVLEGMQDYIVILCSNQEKAEEILESIKTEIYNNDKLEELYPGPIACFRHIEDTPQRARNQTYGGDRSYLYWGTKTIRFPHIADEPSSGKFIEIRPITNTKGLHKKVKAGPDAGKIFRPTLFLIDDPQTHDDAKSETTVRNIVGRIKRDALRGGSHAKRASAIMSITPVVPGDVAWHFEANEHSWDIVKYKMIEKFPDMHDWWMTTYAEIYTNYDRTLRGDRTSAALRAMELVKDNYEKVHAGSEVTWEHAYAWDEEPQTEISAVQHAYNIILDDGMEDFEFECQCNTEYGLYQEGESLHAPVIQIMSKMLPYKRNLIPQKTTKIVAHIDINKDFFSYVILTSPRILQPHIIDYGTYPKQPGLFSKRNVIVPLATLYPHNKDFRDILYAATKELIDILATRVFIREDGAELTLDAIGVDINYEEGYVGRAIKESHHRPIVIPCSGTFVGADDDLLHEKVKADVIDVYENCFRRPNRDHTLDFLNFDTNYFKTELHRGFNMQEGVKGSLTMFGKEIDGTPCDPERHRVIGDHCNAERPERELGKKTKRHRIVWKEKMHQPDNEYLDNIANCYALLASLGVKLQIDPSSPEKKAEKEIDMNDFMRNQKSGRRLL